MRQLIYFDNASRLSRQSVLYILMSGIFFVGLTSCNDDAIFEEEMYKKVFALISQKDYNVYEEVHELTGGETVGYIAASCGGTGSTEEDIDITLEEDATQLDVYNKAIYDADELRYARPLPSGKYDIDNYHIKIPAGERGGKTMIRIRAEGLSPDSTYFVSLKVAAHSAYEVNPDKNTILYQVSIKNRYASQSPLSAYRMNGNYDGANTGGNKPVHPLAWNKVRIMAGIEAFQADLAIIDRAAIVLEITADNRVRITPWKDIAVQTISGDPDYPNTFDIVEENGRKYNIFRLRYDYILAGTTHQMKEELRMETK